MFCWWDRDKSAILRCAGELEDIQGVLRTDLITGDFASAEGWKLKGPAPSPFSLVPFLSGVAGVKYEIVVEGMWSDSYWFGDRVFGSNGASGSIAGSF
jgi:hypothetical protein